MEKTVETLVERDNIGQLSVSPHVRVLFRAHWENLKVITCVNLHFKRQGYPRVVYDKTNKNVQRIFETNICS